MQDLKVSVTGGGEETSFTKGFISSEIEKNVARWRKWSRINLVNIDIKRIDKGGRVQYTVRIEATGQGAHHADASDWSLEKAMTAALNRLDKELLKLKEKLQ